ncbi:MAG: hypothetical protein R3B89_33415 [Polyangiaceae bacterium]
MKQAIVTERGYLNKRLEAEDTAEFLHKPAKAKREYRVVVLRKMITEERGQLSLSTDFKYFFYVTNDLEMTQAEVVTESNCVASRKTSSASSRRAYERSTHRSTPSTQTGRTW